MIEAMKQWLEALEGFIPYLPLKDEAQCNRYDNAITSLRQAIREHAMYEVQRLGQEIEQEPVAWNSGVPPLYPQIRDGETISVEYLETTHPPQRTWQGLTDEEIIDVIHPLVMADMPDEATDYEIARAVEAKLKEKNT